MIKSILFTFILSTLLGAVLSLFLSPNLFGSDFFIFSLLIIGISYGIANSLFLSLLYYLGIDRIVFTKVKFIIIEIMAQYVVFFVIHKLLVLVPYEYRFDITPTSTSQNLFFSFPFELLYTFLVLFISIRIVNKKSLA